MPKPSPILAPESPSTEGDHKQRELAESGASVESTPPKPRRRFTAAEKLRLVKAADAAVAPRKEAIYSSHLSSWRQQIGAGGAGGLAPKKPGRKSKLDDKERRLLAVEKENAVLKRKLQIAEGLIALQKKAHEILGIALPAFDEESS